MSEAEGFLSRWARRKRESGAGKPADAPEQSAPRAAATPTPAPSGERAPPAPETPSVDLSALPPIESITATTDIRPFLAPGVPAELARAALRRAWVADPSIRDFIGIAESQWDFTNPQAIPGFGTLGSLDEVRRLLATVAGNNDEGAASASGAEANPSPIAPSGETAVASDPAEANATASNPTCQASPDDAAAAEGRSAPALPVPANAHLSDSDKACAAMQKDDAAAPASESPTRRAHGGALPR